MNTLDLVNKTGWDTKALRKFVLAGLKAEVGEWFKYTVIVENLRVNARYNGWGRYHQNWMRILIPPVDGYEFALPKKSDIKAGKSGLRKIHTISHLYLDTDTLLRAARTLAHEVQHNKGEQHKDMTRSSALPVEWAHTLVSKGFQIPRKPQPKPKAKPNLQEKRATHAKMMLAKHEAELRRKQKLVKKWKAKVRYYDKALEKKAANKK